MKTNRIRITRLEGGDHPTEAMRKQQVTVTLELLYGLAAAFDRELAEFLAPLFVNDREAIEAEARNAVKSTFVRERTRLEKAFLSGVKSRVGRDILKSVGELSQQGQLQDGTQRGGLRDLEVVAAMLRGLVAERRHEAEAWQKAQETIVE